MLGNEGKIIIGFLVVTVGIGGSLLWSSYRTNPQNIAHVQTIKSITTQGQEAPKSLPRRTIPTPTPTVVPETREPKVIAPEVSLLGTVIGSHPADSMAILKDMATGREGTYRLGEMVQGRRLHKIGRGYVILLGENAKEEVVYLESGPSNAPIVAVSNTEYVVNRDLISEEIGGDVGRLLREAMVVPYVSDWRLQGLKIARLEPAGLIAQAGIVEGDVIRSVNGRKISRIDQALRLYQEMRNHPVESVVVEIERDGYRSNLTYKID